MQSVRAKGAGSFVELSGSSMFRNCDPSSLCAVYGARIIVRGMVGVEVRACCMGDGRGLWCL